MRFLLIGLVFLTASCNKVEQPRPKAKPFFDYIYTVKIDGHPEWSVCSKDEDCRIIQSQCSYIAVNESSYQSAIKYYKEKNAGKNLKCERSYSLMIEKCSNNLCSVAVKKEAQK